MSAEKVLAQVAELEQLLERASPRPWWNSHGEPAAGDKSLWDEWEELDKNPELDEPMDRGRQWDLLFAGDVEDVADTELIVGAVNALPALLELKLAAAEWAVALHEIHKKTFSSADDPELVRFQERERRLAEIALVVAEGV